MLLSIGHAQVESLVRDGKRSGRLLQEFKRRIDVPIAAILIINTIAHTIGAAVAGASYANVFSSDSLWLFSIIFTVAVLLFTEIIPKTLGVTHAGQLAGPVAHGIKALTILLGPLVKLSEMISSSIRGGRDLPVTSVEEIRLLAALGRAEGLVGARTASIIVGATHLAQLKAGDVMLPRQRVAFISQEEGRDEIVRKMQESGFSRFPFSPTRELDDTTGIVLARQLLFYLHDHPQDVIDWGSIVAEALVVPATKPANELLRTFRESGRHMAVVVDEYGGVEGIVTLEDVLEEIVGDIVDESDRPKPDVWRQGDGSVHVLAGVDLRRVCNALSIPWMPESEVTSIGGYVAEQLGHVPVVGDSVVWREYDLKVLAANPRQAELIEVRPRGTGTGETS